MQDQCEIVPPFKSDVNKFLARPLIPGPGVHDPLYFEHSFWGKAQSRGVERSIAE